MPTRQAHYLAAEALLDEAREVGAKIRALNEERKQFNTDDEEGMRDYRFVTSKMDDQGKKAMGIYAQAQVHATLATTPPFFHDESGFVVKGVDPTPPPKYGAMKTTTAVFGD